jgi:hypothetical protein
MGAKTSPSGGWLLGSHYPWIWMPSFPTRAALGCHCHPLEKSEPPLEKFASAPCWHLHHAGCWLNRVPLGSPYYYPPIIWCHVTVISRVCICLDKILDCTVHKIHNTSGYIRSDMSLKSPLCKKKNHRTFTSFSIYPGDKNKSIKHILQPYVDLTHVFGTHQKLLYGYLVASSKSPNRYHINATLTM